MNMRDVALNNKDKISKIIEDIALDLSKVDISNISSDDYYLYVAFERFLSAGERLNNTLSHHLPSYIKTAGLKYSG